MADPAASTTAKPSAEAAAKPSREVCRFYLQGQCKFGPDCRNLHPPDAEIRPAPKKGRSSGRRGGRDHRENRDGDRGTAPHRGRGSGGGGGGRGTTRKDRGAPASSKARHTPLDTASVETGGEPTPQQQMDLVTSRPSPMMAPAPSRQGPRPETFASKLMGLSLSDAPIRTASAPPAEQFKDRKPIHVPVKTSLRYGGPAHPTQEDSGQQDHPLAREDEEEEEEAAATLEHGEAPNAGGGRESAQGTRSHAEKGDPLASSKAAAGKLAPTGVPSEGVPPEPTSSVDQSDNPEATSSNREGGAAPGAATQRHQHSPQQQAQLQGAAVYAAAASRFPGRGTTAAPQVMSHGGMPPPRPPQGSMMPGHGTVAAVPPAQRGMPAHQAYPSGMVLQPGPGSYYPVAAATLPTGAQAGASGGASATAPAELNAAPQGFNPSGAAAGGGYPMMSMAQMTIPPLPPPAQVPVLRPDVPVFCIDVECVATGQQHHERSVAQIGMVDAFGNFVLNVFVRPEKPVVSYLTPLTGVTKEKLDQHGMPEKEALELLRGKLAPNCVIIGMNIRKDIEWLGLEQDKDFSSLIDLADVFRVWNAKYGSFTYFGLDHVVTCWLNVPRAGAGNHDALEDAYLSMALFNYYRQLQFNNVTAVIQQLQWRTLNTPIAPSFAKSHPTFEGCCMGNRRTCKCGAPFFS
uniref:C3H1-type domain-containing protein n=1 Tax=Rhizochromulina marina TaxID=1034831 RepID=A0A7S2WPU7_9STRA|mmetsp:Transcript_29695/g.86514  ORF Transcript_29695/g.86514 Transcript_29695/m.86514 type:complete len:686 (+) Transcript_29695:214-2271(+)